MTTPDALSGRMEMTPYILIVTGWRHTLPSTVYTTLDEIVERNGPPLVLVHGGAPGADRHAGEWAKRRGFRVVEMPALWDSEGDKAGPIRNGYMLAFTLILSQGWPAVHHDPRLIPAFGELYNTVATPPLVRAVAFPHATSRGTRHMMGLLKKAQIPTLVRPVTP